MNTSEKTPEHRSDRGTSGGFSLLDAFSRPQGFRADQRFGAASPLPPPEPETHVEPEDQPDPIAEAFAQGFHAGHEEALRAAQAAAEADEAARAKLGLSFARLDAALEEELRLRLRETVAALCEAAVMPLALDEDALVRRIGTAAAMLARADDERVIRLHPDDLRMVEPRLQSEWVVEADPSLERGSIRVEGVAGGVEDGPATWRRAIAEALHQI